MHEVMNQELTDSSKSDAEDPKRRIGRNQLRVQGMPLSDLSDKREPQPHQEVGTASAEIIVEETLQPVWPEHSGPGGYCVGHCEGTVGGLRGRWGGAQPEEKIKQETDTIWFTVAFCVF